jgi:hypothetical protein
MARIKGVRPNAYDSGGGGGASDHTALTHLLWTSSAHTLSASYKLAGSSGTTAAAEITYTAFTATLLDDANAATAQATLGLVIGTNVQAWGADLDALDALGDGLPFRAAGVWGATALGDLAISGGSVQVTQARGLRESGGTTLVMGAVAAGELLIRSGATLVGAAIGSVVQGYNAVLTAIAALGGLRALL